MLPKPGSEMATAYAVSACTSCVSRSAAQCRARHCTTHSCASKLCCEPSTAEIADASRKLYAQGVPRHEWELTDQDERHDALNAEDLACKRQGQVRTVPAQVPA